ncbi:MAG: peptidoglycan-binding domain-containing protein [Candidatus Acidiferrales bacterium]
MMTLIQHMKRVKVWAIALSAAVALAFVAAAPAHVRQTGSSTSPSHSAPSHHRKSSGRHRRSSRMHLPAAPTRDRISEIQSALARGGYYKGDPNGKWDSDTVAAMQKFQSASGLDSTGKLDAPTLQKLGLGSDIAGVSAPKPVVPKCCATPSTSTAPPAAEKPAPSAQTLAPADPATTASNRPSDTAASDPKAPQH